MVLKNPIFNFYSLKSSSFTNLASQLYFCHSKFSGPKIPTTTKSSISVPPTNRNNFSDSIPSAIKSNDSKPTRTSSQTSHLSALAKKPLPFSVFYSSLLINFFSKLGVQFCLIISSF